MSKFRIRSGGALVSAAILGIALSSSPLRAAEQPVPATKAQPAEVETAHARRSAERSEHRIMRMHDRLAITSAQEDLWGKVAKVMRENEATFRASVGERYSRTEPMTAVDDLKSFQMIADEHSSGLKKLIPAFDALYVALTPDQKKSADAIFAHRDRHDRDRHAGN